MIRLPVLSTQELAFLSAEADDGKVLDAFSGRLRSRLMGGLRVPGELEAAPALTMPHRETTSQAPSILLDAGACESWLAARYGVRPGRTGREISQHWRSLLLHKVQLALAESAFNLGPAAVWPSAIRLEMRALGLRGNLQIALHPDTLYDWAREHVKQMRGKKR